MKFRKRKSNIKVSQEKPEITKFSWYTCKNCGYSFEGNYCASCGQSVKEVQQPLGQFVKDMAGSLFSFDLRLFRSIPILLFRPGALSDEYIAGKRKSYVAPFRLFFFMSVILFFLISWQTQKRVDEVMNSPELSAEVDSMENTIDRISSTIGDNDSILKINSLSEGLGFVNLWQESLEAELLDTTLTKAQRMEKELELASTQNPDYIISKFYQYLSWSFFILMPLFASILFMFFFKKRKYYVEHLIFSINLHSFYFLIMILVVLIAMIFPSALSKMGFWIFLFLLSYSIIGIRNFYKKRWISALLYSATIFFLYFITSVALLGASIYLAIQYF